MDRSGGHDDITREREGRRIAESPTVNVSRERRSPIDSSARVRIASLGSIHTPSAPGNSSRKILR